MTNDGPGSSRKPGLAAVALFGVLAAVILSAANGFADPVGYPAGEPIVHNIGYALFDIDLGEIASEGFLAAFLIIALALDVALDSAIYLAKQEDEGTIISALTDGGQDIEQGGDR
jgi:NADH-quinone oxidoreductase subunit J